jgi:PAB-dependent poly(A)-specific ribonuclease subunit 3
LHNFFLPSDLYTFLHDRTEAKLFTASADAALPAELHVYHSLHELLPEATPQEKSPRVFGYVSDVYRAKCRLDGRLYCLRRIEGQSRTPSNLARAQSPLQGLNSPKKRRSAFLTNGGEYGTQTSFPSEKHLLLDSSMMLVSHHSAYEEMATDVPLAVVFAYDYHPKSKTLYEEHLATGPGPGQPFAGISERILWSYVAQISNGLKAIHTAGLACRTVEPTKILLTGRNRWVNM